MTQAAVLIIFEPTHQVIVPFPIRRSLLACVHTKDQETNLLTRV